jgi:sec-independent protein translocase protein TatB
VFANLNVWEIGVLVLLALFIFGPERLPKLIGDAVKVIRTLRGMARNATDDLSRELGHDVSLEDLHPKTFIRKHLLSEEDEAVLRRPFDDAFRDIKQVSTDTSDYVAGRPRAEGVQPTDPAAPDSRYTTDPRYDTNPGYGQNPGGSEPRHYDSDAT